MRRCNAILGMGIAALFAVHAIAGTFQLSGLLPGGSSAIKVLAFLMILLIIMHAVIGSILMIRSIRVALKSGTFYFRENKLFWTRRLSGIALMIFIVDHLLIFYNQDSEIIRLSFFGKPQLFMSVLLVIVLAIHILSNVRPLLIGFGYEGRKGRAADVFTILTIILVFCSVAFLIYYVRWL